ncbi:MULTISPECIES: BMC domain-containing protein [Citrobacter]|uniref:BMC domain-containing protein n=1 Tax=Citrobacter TaxID=544 RepID=UPI000DFDC186|nr:MULTISPECIES: BMC domain-containing protein [Citrobacter]MCE5348688.1 BMC domain-containing protein [Citrobacter koseri]MDM3026869.1 BMC domain-containing protein [Citrobacter sp. CK194]STA80099.1 propanediol utilization protein PduK [Citrobacter koseri]STT21199.1 propanediol utilization polyhedral body protein PduK [Citrobacter koseri]HCB2603241.1 BMC domain-containing protein [Citrobacter koseri]
MKQSLGLLEVSGLALAISCADVMAKAASITLVGLERTNGSGWTVIKITGDVASVQSAIITGASFADQQQGLIAHKVIARPGEGILSRATVIPPAPMPAPEPETEPESEPDVVVVEESVPEAEPETGMVSCNLCLDPACKRQKGEPRSLCLHSGK